MAADLCGHAWTSEEIIAEALAESAKLVSALPAPPLRAEPDELELLVYINAVGPKRPQLSLF